MSEVKPTIRELCDTLQSKLTEIESVLEWASENVWSCGVNSFKASDPKQREFFATLNNGVSFQGNQTLYAALKSAWEGREK